MNAPSRVDKLRGDIASLRYMAAITRDAAPALFWASVTQAVVGPAVSVAFMVAGGMVVGAVPAAVGSGFTSPEARRMVAWLAAVAGLFLIQFLIAHLGHWFGESIGRRVNTEAKRRAVHVATRPTGIAHLEDSKVLDRIHSVQGLGMEQTTLGQACGALSPVAARYIAIAGSLVILARFRWWMPALLVPLFWLARVAMRRHLQAIISGMVDQTGDFRRATYYTDLALRPDAAKENRIFGLGTWLADRLRTDLLEVLRPTWDDRRSRRRRLVPAVLVLGAGLLVAYAAIVAAGVNGEVSIGEVTILMSAVAATAAALQYDNDDLFIEQGLQLAPRVMKLDEAVSAGMLPVAESPAPADGLPRREISFENVTFSYPGTDLKVLDGFTLALRAGESVAIVGANGAGKTTLIKLLARLYDPTEGHIEVDGVDIRDLDPPEWQRRVGAIFQDFTRYAMPARYNIAVGSLSAIDDDRAIRAAAERAGVLDVIDAMPNGMDTVLSRRFTDGIDPSGGQWQRIALARALLAVDQGAGVLVLDEPTANLDVRAEVELYDRFLELTRGVTTVVVSHRFSTVRRADRIVVVEGGRVVEDGSHDELLESEGIYARMFRLQSERFADQGPAEESADEIEGAHVA